MGDKSPKNKEKRKKKTDTKRNQLFLLHPSKQLTRKSSASALKISWHNDHNRGLISGQTKRF